MLLAHEVPRVSVAQLRATYKPRRFRELTSIEIVVGGHRTVLQLVTTDGDGCIRGMRKWLRCEKCSKNKNVLGWVLGFGWSCQTCLGWRSRGRPAVDAFPTNEPAR